MSFAQQLNDFVGIIEQWYDRKISKNDILEKGNNLKEIAKKRVETSTEEDVEQAKYDLEIIEKFLESCQNEIVDDNDSNKEVKETQKKLESETKRPIAIVLSKEMTDEQIDTVILRGHQAICRRDARDVSVVTDSWRGDARPFAIIPGAKKLFARAIDRGLIGLLIYHDFHDVSRNVYCIAYQKGKVDTSRKQLKFKEPSEKEFACKAIDSLKTFQNLLFRFEIDP
jgi:hypothetical protein